MKIGYIAEPYEEFHASGMGYAVLQTIRHLLIEGAEHQFVVYSSTPVSKEVIPGSYTNILVPKNFFKKFFFFLFLKDKPDLLVFMLPLLPLWVSKGIKTIPIFHELGSQKMAPGGLYNIAVAFLRDRILMPRTLAQALHIVSVSNATKIDILKFYKVQPKKITVIYDGFQDWHKFKESAPSVEEVMKPYFFFAGKVKYRKNVHGMVSGFISFKKRAGADCKLVIAGDHEGDYYKKMVVELEQNNLLKDVYFVGYVDNPRMYSLFTNAVACIFPSFNEGFGMPIVEAMSLGTPVITSNISATAEVGGDAALLIDPYDSESIARAMEKIFSNKELRGELVQKGLERAKLFSWEKFGKEYLEVVKRFN